MPRNPERASWAIAKRWADAIDVKQTEMQSDYTNFPSGFITAEHFAPDVSGYMAGLRILKGGAEQAMGVNVLNFIQGAGITLDIVPGAPLTENITITSTGGGGGAPTDADYLTASTQTGLSAPSVIRRSCGLSVDSRRSMRDCASTMVPQ